MPQLINPRTDEGFKIIFGQENSKPFMIKFLNAVLMGNPVIVNIDYEDKEFIPIYHSGHKYVFDIYCTTNKDTHVIIEMQKCNQENFKDRCLRYMCSDIVSHSYRGDKLTKKQDPVIGVFIMDFLPEENDNKLRRDLALR